MNKDLRLLGIILKKRRSFYMFGFVLGIACGGFIGVLLMCLMKISADE